MGRSHLMLRLAALVPLINAVPLRQPPSPVPVISVSSELPYINSALPPLSDNTEIGRCQITEFDKCVQHFKNVTVNQELAEHGCYFKSAIRCDHRRVADKPLPDYAPSFNDVSMLYLQTPPPYCSDAWYKCIKEIRLPFFDHVICADHVQELCFDPSKSADSHNELLRYSEEFEWKFRETMEFLENSIPEPFARFHECRREYDDEHLIHIKEAPGWKLPMLNADAFFACLAYAKNDTMTSTNMEQHNNTHTHPSNEGGDSVHQAMHQPDKPVVTNDQNGSTNGSVPVEVPDRQAESSAASDKVKHHETRADVKLPRPLGCGDHCLPDREDLLRDMMDEAAKKQKAQELAEAKAQATVPNTNQEQILAGARLMFDSLMVDWTQVQEMKKKVEAQQGVVPAERGPGHRRRSMRERRAELSSQIRNTTSEGEASVAIATANGTSTIEQRDGPRVSKAWNDVKHVFDFFCLGRKTPPHDEPDNSHPYDEHSRTHDKRRFFDLFCDGKFDPVPIDYQRKYEHHHKRDAVNDTEQVDSVHGVHGVQDNNNDDVYEHTITITTTSTSTHAETDADTDEHERETRSLQKFLNKIMRAWRDALRKIRRKGDTKSQSPRLRGGWSKGAAWGAFPGEHEKRDDRVMISEDNIDSSNNTQSTSTSTPSSPSTPASSASTSVSVSVSVSDHDHNHNHELGSRGVAPTGLFALFSFFYAMRVGDGHFFQNVLQLGENIVTKQHPLKGISRGRAFQAQTRKIKSINGNIITYTDGRREYKEWN